jgi:hypothetical protein
MRRREFIALMCASVTSPFAALTQEPGRTYRLGVMTGVDRAAPRMVAFFDELKLLGFVEGQNLKIVINGLDLRDDQYAEVAAALTNDVTGPRLWPPTAGVFPCRRPSLRVLVAVPTAAIAG